YVNLLENSTFQDTMIQEANDTGGLQLITKVWGCASRQDNLPRGLWKTEEVDGRVVLRLIRSDNAISHGETRCLAFLGQTGRDVSDYDYLEMRASFDISYQSLSGCGWDGSECPLMLQMDYIDQNNELQTWRHGFYYAQPQADYPASCNTCRQEHDRVNEKAWYTYTSGNLKALLGPKQIPRTILNVQFYASGHQYDVAIGEVSLLAGQLVGEPGASDTTSP
ncbi:MAG TPA: hypothetical protein VHO69_18585, partial [Phototrophicaceae bacterium]|nr:hypothetical protein [Phototrophicaceae bacterium]